MLYDVINTTRISYCPITQTRTLIIFVLALYSLLTCKFRNFFFPFSRRLRKVWDCVGVFSKSLSSADTHFLIAVLSLHRSTLGLADSTGFVMRFTCDEPADAPRSNSRRTDPERGKQTPQMTIDTLREGRGSIRD